MKPYSEACDQNRDFILAVIEPLFRDRQRVLEVGSGTGQHAVYFAQRMPHLTWCASDRLESHAGMRAWLDEARLPNVTGPIELDVCQPAWPQLQVDAVFSANTAHIMSREEVVAFFAGVGRLLPGNGLFCLYGPFNYGGRYTSESNERFDRWLHQRDPRSGIKDFDDLDRLARQAGMDLQGDYEMPVNNRILCWRRQERVL
jgi:cyclopropane fatty-acyl-phospholipid synthase-like methyltransferase